MWIFSIFDGTSAWEMLGDRTDRVSSYLVALEAFDVFGQQLGRQMRIFAKRRGRSGPSGFSHEVDLGMQAGPDANRQVFLSSNFSECPDQAGRP